MSADNAVLYRIAARLRSAPTDYIPQPTNERTARVRAEFAATVSALRSRPLIDVTPNLLEQAPSRHSGAERTGIANHTTIRVSLLSAPVTPLPPNRMALRHE